MKQRLISAGVGIALLIGLLFVYDSIAVPVVFSAIAILAVYECWKAFKPGSVFYLIISAVTCLFTVFFHDKDILLILTVYLILSGTIACIDCSGSDRFGRASSFVLFSLIIIFGFKGFMYARDAFCDRSDRIFILIMTLCLGWLCDTFALLFGKSFGKKKLSPYISPNKTVEGAVGGVLATSILITILFYVYSVLFTNTFVQKNVVLSLILYFSIGLFGSVIGIFGDLFASYAKRSCGVKDFGNIMPGHGGALDRIDSVLFTSMFMCIIVRYFFI